MSADRAAPGEPARGGYRLDLHDREGLWAYLGRQGILSPDERIIAIARAGEGNMNLTLRVTTQTRSLIVKQGRPWVEKYPQIAAPAGRTIVEGRFYALVQNAPTIAARMPRLLGRDAQAPVLILEDFAAAHDYTNLYAGAPLTDATIDALVSYLGHLHQLPIPPAEQPILINAAMRALNHQHIFRFPLDPQNGLNLDAMTDGLTAVARALAADSAYVQRVHNLGERYLHWAAGPLCHGDFFPGSWLATADGVKVIDPEFCLLGPREFDLGVMLAHLHLAGLPPEPIDSVLFHYERYAKVDRALVYALAGVEIMRRLIGVAQLPLRADLATKRRLLELSRELVLGGPP